MNIYGVKGYLTPDDVPEDRQCRIFQIPNSTAWLSVFMGALLPLIYSESWQEYGDLTPDEAADEALSVIWDAYNNNYCALDVQTPFWDDGTDVDATAPADSQPWYGELVVTGMGGMGAAEPTLDWFENLAIWAFAGFIAYAGSPLAAIAFVPFARKFVLTFKGSSAGAIVRVIFDGLHLADIDTYGVEDEIIQFLVDVGVEPSGQELWVEHSGEHNPDATPDANGDYTIQVVRERLELPVSFALRQNPDNSCQLQQSLDGGDTWALAFDYSLCTPPASQTIVDQTTQTTYNTWNTTTSPTQINFYAPTLTFVTVEGTDVVTLAQRYAALCLACQETVQAVCQSGADELDSALNPALVVGYALALAAAIASVVMSAGATLPLFLAIASAAIEVGVGLASLTNSGDLLDPDIQEKVACLMYHNLASEDVNVTNFKASVGTSQSGWTSAENGVRAAVDAMLNSPANGTNIYNSFLSVLGGIVGAAIGGATVDTCPCPEGCLEIDFTAGTQGWTPFAWTSPQTSSAYPAAGEYAGSQGWHAPNVGGHMQLGLAGFCADGLNGVTSVDIYQNNDSNASFELSICRQSDGVQVGYVQISNLCSGPSCPSPFTHSVTVTDSMDEPLVILLGLYSAYGDAITYIEKLIFS